MAEGLTINLGAFTSMPVEYSVPLMLFASSAIMALAWLGHLRFRHWKFLTAMMASWALVLPEYLLNVYSTRLGHDVYSGAQMASMNLSFGVLCVALVSAFLLRERLTWRQGAGFALMGLSITLIMWG